MTTEYVNLQKKIDEINNVNRIDNIKEVLREMLDSHLQNSQHSQKISSSQASDLDKLSTLQYDLMKELNKINEKIGHLDTVMMS